MTVKTEFKNQGNPTKTKRRLKSMLECVIVRTRKEEVHIESRNFVLLLNFEKIFINTSVLMDHADGTSAQNVGNSSSSRKDVFTLEHFSSPSFRVKVFWVRTLRLFSLSFQRKENGLRKYSHQHIFPTSGRPNNPFLKAQLMPSITYMSSFFGEQSDSKAFTNHDISHSVAQPELRRNSADMCFSYKQWSVGAANSLHLRLALKRYHGSSSSEYPWTRRF